MAADLKSDQMPLLDHDAERDHRARLYVAVRAFDIDDARLLLDILGLNGRPVNGGGWQQRKTAKKARCVRCHQLRSIKGMGMCGTCYEAVRRG